MTIYRLFFANSDCYKANVRQTSAGVQVHSTGANTIEEAHELYNRVPRLLKDKVKDILIESGMEELIAE